MSKQVKFNQEKETHLKLLAQYVPVVARVHGGNHPESHQVRKEIGRASCRERV